MLYNTVHLIWWGGDKEADAAVQHWRQFGGDRRIMVHTDASSLLPQWRDAYDRAIFAEAQLDLLRWSILLQQGGWCFDCGVRVSVPLDTIEQECSITADRCFVTFYNPLPLFPAGDTLACSPDWPGRQAILDYVAKQTAIRSPWLFGTDMLQPLLQQHREWFCWGDPKKYAYATADWTKRVFVLQDDAGPFDGHLILHPQQDGKIYQPSLLSHPDAAAVVTDGVTRLGLSTELAIRYIRALWRWRKAGYPTRTEAEVQRIFYTFCNPPGQPCQHYVDGTCEKCGCHVNTSRIAITNKAAMLTEHCPLVPPLW